MNQQQVSKVEIDDGNEVQTIKIDSEKPFVFILPNNVGSLTIYDINGNIVESVHYEHYLTGHMSHHSYNMIL